MHILPSYANLHPDYIRCRLIETTPKAITKLPAAKTTETAYGLGSRALLLLVYKATKE